MGGVSIFLLSKEDLGPGLNPHSSLELIRIFAVKNIFKQIFKCTLGIRALKISTFKGEKIPILVLGEKH